MSWVSHWVDEGRKEAQKTYDTIVSKALDAAGIKNRGLRAGEKAIVQFVFHNSVPLDRVVLLSLIGVHGRPFTLPGSLLAVAAPLLDLPRALLLEAVLADFWDKYLIFFGSGYNDAINDAVYTKPGDVLVHELTHVWQGHNNAFSWWYVFNSVFWQCKVGLHAYDYTPGADWDTYEAEQQAHIVQDWYAGGRPFSDERFGYMVSNVWPGDPHAELESIP